MTFQAPYKVLCVCLGNICRSPTAEVVLQHACQQRGLNVWVDSAGTSNYHPNKAPDIRSQQHAKQRGYDISSLRARQIQLADFANFDLILAMDLDNLKDLQKLQQQAQQQYAHHLKADVALMSAHDPAYCGQAVPDPYYGAAQDFERVLDQCESSSAAWAAVLAQDLQSNAVK
ncbi:low molecular weight protein-tyrosine-phosphatase [Acinetobacter larvae]|uniref:protein-tyrosine-phosphatase n=1 Tax=Acinetobacter larvae TaxID=1789224 RepID=A0A1B2LYI6_9GAMM|nr:low molecular weight protein-tyrosine-phosphatase [Acinetobacter larvae]AOA58007.1 protein-tyrosine-phosphatase [Acinetobacter larvae]